jgi:hypothetical protein
VFTTACHRALSWAPRYVSVILPSILRSPKWSFLSCLLKFCMHF